MLVLWRDPPYLHDEQQPAGDTAVLDALLDRLHQEARTAGVPNAVQIYAGNRYPEDAHPDGDHWVPTDPGDGDQPELFLVVGAGQSPLYWTQPPAAQHVSHGQPPSQASQPGDDYAFAYLYGGSQSYAPQSSLVPTEQAREAARLFIATGGQRPANITWHTEETSP